MFTTDPLWVIMGELLESVPLLVRRAKLEVRVMYLLLPLEVVRVAPEAIANVPDKLTFPAIVVVPVLRFMIPALLSVVFPVT